MKSPGSERSVRGTLSAIACQHRCINFWSPDYSPIRERRTPPASIGNSLAPSQSIMLLEMMRTDCRTDCSIVLLEARFLVPECVFAPEPAELPSFSLGTGRLLLP
jgi:hypothetical protein